MKILFLAHRTPFPPNKGDKIRSYNEIKFLSNNHEIDLASACDDINDLKNIKELNKICNRSALVFLDKKASKIKSLSSFFTHSSISVSYFYLKKLQEIIDRWIYEKDYHAIICFCSPMAEYLFRSDAYKKKYIDSDLKKRPKLIMDFCDLDSDKWLQYAKSKPFPFNLIFKRESIYLLEYEKRLASLFDYSVFVSKKEAELFKNQTNNHENIGFIENGVDYNFFSPSKNTKQNSSPVLVFTGVMDYYANIEGALWFCEKVFPELKKEFPDLKFYIAGSSPTRKIKNLKKINGIHVTGFVKDIRKYYEIADISVVPLRIARGIQNKVLEAMSMGNPVITTSKGLEGIDADPEKHLLTADSEDEFVSQIIKVLYDKDLSKRLGLNARSFIKDNFSWNAKILKFEKILKDKTKDDKK